MALKQNRVYLESNDDNNLSTTEIKDYPSVTNSVCENCLKHADLPPLHVASYTGHQECLMVLLSDPSQPDYDKKMRTPLFYACAGNRVECCGILLKERKIWLDVADSQQDTPIHVSCFFGWQNCLQLLLEAGANPNLINQKGFRPSHIAKTRLCLELLLGFGDDLLQGDSLGRSPLFIAAARNRIECVEYLCGWDYQTQSYNLEQSDQRGDRPIHAAACNGSKESLQILLRYGSDIYALNEKEKTALDLAKMNKHQECIEILEKYLKDLENENLKNISIHNVSSQRQDGSFAEWSECFDPISSAPFYFNNITGVCQWEKPTNFIPNGYETLSVYNQSSTTYSQQASDDNDTNYVWVKKKKDSVSVVGGKKSQWEAVQDLVSNAIYYRNDGTGEVQWEEPEELQLLQRQVASNASKHASELWDELNRNRESLALALDKERNRQKEQNEKRIRDAKLLVLKQQEERRNRQGQEKITSLLPKCSFVRQQSRRTMSVEEDEEIIELCSKDPILEMFLSTQFDPSCFHSKSFSSSSPPSLRMTMFSKLCRCIFKYYATQEDPLIAQSISKLQFRFFLKDAELLPSTSSDRDKPLKMHIADLVFVQAHRNNQGKRTTLVSMHENHLDVDGFVESIQLIGERIYSMVEEVEDDEVEDIEKWMVNKYLLKLVHRLGWKMVEKVHECQEMLKKMNEEEKDVMKLMDKNRSILQNIYKHYASKDPRLKLLTFSSLHLWCIEFGLLPHLCDITQLHQLCQSIHWISGHSQTLVISYDKFIQFLILLPLYFSKSMASLLNQNHESFYKLNALERQISFFHFLEKCTTNSISFLFTNEQDTHTI